MFKRKTPEEETKIRESKKLRELIKLLKRRKTIKLIFISVDKDTDEVWKYPAITGRVFLLGIYWIKYIIDYV